MKTDQNFQPSHILIKVCSKEEYIEDIKHGKIYMNESGYFRKLEDNYRGDRFDGKSPINLESYKNKTMILESLDNPSERLELPIVTVSNFITGFDRDDKIPMFCCSLVSEEILEFASSGELKIRKEYLREMRKFGNFFCMFTLKELVFGLRQVEEKNEFVMLGRKVQYTNIKKEYLPEILNDQNRCQYEPFFKKDITYRWQNEWRVLFHSGNGPIISNDENHYIAQIPAFQWFESGTLDDLEHKRLPLQPIE